MTYLERNIKIIKALPEEAQVKIFTYLISNYSDYILSSPIRDDVLKIWDKNFNKMTAEEAQALEKIIMKSNKNN